MIGGLTVATLLVISGFFGAASPETTNDSGDCGSWLLACPSAAGDGYRYLYDASTHTVVKVPSSKHDKGSRTSTHPVYSYAFAPACPGSTPHGATVCQHALSACQGVNAGKMMMDVWRMEVAPLQSGWIYMDAECIGVSDRTSVTDITTAVHEDIRNHLPTPVPHVQPSAGTVLVQLPVLLSVPEAGPQGFDVTQPVPGHVVATPTYTWTFDDGTTLVGAGRPLDDVDPRLHPDHYLSHTYHHTAPAGWVELTTTWNATFTLEGGTTFTLDPIIMGPTRTTYAVKQARAVLVAH